MSVAESNTVTDGDSSWVVPQACTLPTAEQPLRVRQFGELFAGSARAITRVSPTVLRLRLAASAEAAARELAARETECCSFFSFAIEPATIEPATTEPVDESVTMDVTVPASHVDVLDGLAALATARMA